jgi:hypothetical protein
MNIQRISAASCSNYSLLVRNKLHSTLLSSKNFLSLLKSDEKNEQSIVLIHDQSILENKDMKSGNDNSSQTLANSPGAKALFDHHCQGSSPCSSFFVSFLKFPLLLFRGE